MIFYQLKDITCISSLVVGNIVIASHCSVGPNQELPIGPSPPGTNWKPLSAFEFSYKSPAYHADVVSVEEDLWQLDLAARVITFPMSAYGSPSHQPMRVWRT